jgi:outer membrane murein-binding lipoprotein Lpp
MLTDTIFEQIDDKCSHGQYAEFKVIIMTSNSYINAAKLCTDYGKRFTNWLALKAAKKLMNELGDHISAAYNPAAEQPACIELKGGNPKTRGTYVHPLLVPHIAGWISTKFAFKVSKIVNDFISYEYKQKINKLTSSNNTLLSEKLTLIEEVRLLRQETREATSKLLEENKEIKEKADTIITQNVTLNNKVDNLQGIINRIETKLKSNGSNIPANDALKESIIIMQKDDIITFIRAQNRAVKQSMRNKKNQGFGLVDGVSDIASTVGTLNVVKSQLLSDGHICKVDSRMYNDVKLVDITALDLVRIITTVNNNCKTLEEEPVN